MAEKLSAYQKLKKKLHQAEADLTELALNPGSMESQIIKQSQRVKVETEKMLWMSEPNSYCKNKGHHDLKIKTNDEGFAMYAECQISGCNYRVYPVLIEPDNG